MKKLFFIALYLISIMLYPWWIAFLFGAILLVVFRSYVSVLAGVLFFDALFAPEGAVLVGTGSLLAILTVVCIVAAHVIRTRLLE